MVTRGLHPPVAVHVAVLEGRLVGFSDLLVVEDDPLALLLDVRHVVPARRVLPDVRNKAQQLVLARSVVERERGGAAAGTARAARGAAASSA